MKGYYVWILKTKHTSLMFKKIRCWKKMWYWKIVLWWTQR